LLAAYVQQALNPAWTGLPYRTAEDRDYRARMSYALQWFTCALFEFYPFFMAEHRTGQVRQAIAYN
jgi:hypothetical protein